MEGLTSSIALSLKCTVCKKECDSHADWIEHLLENEHQMLAREECRNWGESVKECVIIAYTDFPVITLGRKIVQVFGCLSRGRFVTDFVTWENRPKIAFIQFESRKKVWEIISKTGRMSQLKIQNRRIQVKKAIDVMELEWNEFFPPQQPVIYRNQLKDSSVQTETLSVSDSKPSQKRKFDCIDINDEEGDNTIPEEKTTNHLPCLIKTVSQDGSSNNNHNPNKGTTSRGPSSLQVQTVTREKNLIPPQSQLFKDNPSNNTTKNESKNMTLVQPKQVSSQKDISNNNLKQSTSTKNQLPLLPAPTKKGCSNDFIPKNGTINHLPSSSLVNPLYEKKNSSCKPTPKKDLSKEKSICNKNAKVSIGKESLKRIPSILELPLERPQGLKQSNTKRRRLTTTDDQEITTTPNNFQVQYKEICDEVMFPDLEYSSIMSMIKSMELCVQETYPKSRLYVFRNIYLKLRNPGSNKLLIFLDTQGIWKEDCDLKNAATVENIQFMNPDLKKPVADFWRKLKIKKLSDAESNTQDFIPELDSFGIEFRHEATDLSFILVTRQHFIIELQTCRLLNYMSSFDNRTISIMAIVKYWGNLNRVIPLVSPEFNDQDALSSVLNQAILLDWLIIVFLSGRRCIPTVRQILERSHKKLIMFDQDIGFHADMAFAKAWSAKRVLPEVDSDDFIKSVFSLVQEFFKFCSQLPSTPFVINLRDGEIIKSEQFSKKLPFCHSATAGVLTKLSNEELTEIKRSNAQVGKPFVSMLHPLCLDHMLGFDKSTFYDKNMNLIKTTTKKLENVTFYGSNDKDNSFIDLKSLLIS